MGTKSAEESKAFVLKAFDTLFNQRDYAKALEFWSDNYIQHSAHIEPGRDGLFNLVRSLPDTLRYQNALVMAEGDYVMLHGRFSGHGRPRAWIAVDIVRLEGGRLAEHWDVLQEEATKEESKSGLPMFGTLFAEEEDQPASSAASLKEQIGGEEVIKVEETEARRVSALLIRNLHGVFGETDPARRRATIDEIYTEDCVFYDPSTGVHRGRDEIDRVAGAIKATHPDFRYRAIAEPEELGNGGRLNWVSGRPGEAPAYAGTDFIIARNGRIVALYLFFDKLP